MIGQRALHHHHQQQQQQQQLSMATTSGYGGASIRAGLKGDVMGQQANNQGGGLRNVDQQHSLEENNSKHGSSLPGSGDDNSTGSWSASNSLNGCGDGARRANATAGTTNGRLSVVLPQSQKSLMTPTIITSEGGLPTPCQLYSSLIQFNGQEVGLFTGLPTGCTPTSADGLARAGINPFFLGVAPFSQHQQKTPTVEQQLQQNDLINNQQPQQHMQANNDQQQHQQVADESTGSAAEERRKQLSKLSIDQRLQAANVILTSPLSFLLSPEHEAWLRLGLQQQTHPLAAAAANQPPATGCCPLAANPQHQHHANPHLHPSTTDPMQSSTSFANSTYQTAQDLTSSNQLVAASNRLSATNPSGQPPTATTANSQHNQQVSPIVSQYNNTCNLSNGYNQGPVQQTTASSIVVPTITTSYASQQHSQHPAVGPASFQSPFASQAGANTAAADERTRSGAGPEADSQRLLPGLMGPPVAHHHHLQQQQQQQHQPNHQQPNLNQSPNTVFLMSTHPLDPRFIELHQQQQRQQSQLNLQGSQGLHAIQQQQQDGARSINFYEPQQLQQLYLAQQHHHQQQQEMYDRQQQQQLHNSACFQQNPLPTYQLVPNELSQARQQQQDSLLSQQTSTYHGNQLETQGSSIENGLQNNSTSLADEATNHHNNYTDSSSSCSGSSSGSESSSSARSSVSRDTNSIDLNVAPSSDGCSTVFTDIAQVMITANAVNGAATTTTTTTTTNPKQVANGVNRKSATNKNKSGDDKTNTDSGNVGDREPPDATTAVVVVKKKSKGGRKKKIVTHEELMARKNRSKERNRVAAKRCRQKRKQFLDELRGRIDNLNDSNKKLLRENNQLKNELEQLRKHHKT